jgi:hypothetical protein
MDYRVLGPLEVRDGEESLPLAGAEQRALLALLRVLATTDRRWPKGLRRSGSVVRKLRFRHRLLRLGE